MNWKIPLFKIYSDEEDCNSVRKILERQSEWADGNEIEEFEKKLKNIVGRKYAVAMNSGTSALHASLLSIDVLDREVIVPSATFISTVNSVLLAGGIPVFAESEEDTFGLDAKDVEKKITANTKAILCIHYAGFPSRDIKRLKELCTKHDLKLIEDAAESLGADISGQFVGTFGDAAIYSFCQNKIISTGEGGMVVTDSKAIYNKCRLLRSHGRSDGDYFCSSSKPEYIDIGYNFRMPSMSAALGLSQLEKINDLIMKRRSIADRYKKGLSRCKQIKFLADIEGHNPVFQLFSFFAENRDQLTSYLEDKGIMSKVYFPPVHLEIPYKNKGYKEGFLPITEKLCKDIITIPLYVQMTDNEINYIIKNINSFYGGRYDEKHF